MDLTTDTFAPSIGYRWTEAGGYELLPDLPGGAEEAATRGVSLNGEVAVGYGWEGTNEASSRATYWLADGQVRRVGDLLAAWGLDLGEMTLSSTLSVSDDGLVFVGSGWLPGDSSAYGRAWIAGVPSFSPPPPPVPEPGALALLGVGLVAPAAAGGAYQIGDDHARSWIVAGRPSGIGTPSATASRVLQRGVGISMARTYQNACAAGSKSGSVQAVASCGAPIALVYVAVARSTVLPTAGSLPSAPGSRSPLHATSYTFPCCLPAASTQPFTICTRSRWPLSGSFSAATRNDGAAAAPRGPSVPPIGTPSR